MRQSVRKREREGKDWLWAVKASRNKLSPKTAGQGVSESSLAGCLHTKGDKNTNRDLAKTCFPVLCHFRCTFFVGGNSKNHRADNTEHTVAWMCYILHACLSVWMTAAVQSSAEIEEICWVETKTKQKGNKQLFKKSFCTNRKIKCLVYLAPFHMHFFFNSYIAV